MMSLTHTETCENISRRQSRKWKADHNPLDMEWTGRYVRSSMNNVDQNAYREHC